MTCSNGVGAVKISDGSVPVSDTDKTELLNEYFVSVGTHDNGVLPHVQPLVTDDIFLDTIDFRRHNILSESNGSAGPDGFPPILLKRRLLPP